MSVSMSSTSCEGNNVGLGLKVDQFEALVSSRLIGDLLVLDSLRKRRVKVIDACALAVIQLRRRHSMLLR